MKEENSQDCGDDLMAKSVPFKNSDKSSDNLHKHVMIIDTWRLTTVDELKKLVKRAEKRKE